MEHGNWMRPSLENEVGKARSFLFPFWGIDTFYSFNYSKIEDLIKLGNSHGGNWPATTKALSHYYVSQDGFIGHLCFDEKTKKFTHEFIKKITQDEIMFPDKLTDEEAEFLLKKIPGNKEVSSTLKMIIDRLHVRNKVRMEMEK